MSFKGLCFVYMCTTVPRVEQELSMFRRMILVVQLLLSLLIKNTSSSIFNNVNCSGILNKTLLEKGPMDRQLRMSECPPWFQLDNQTGICHPGPQLGGIIQQDTHTLSTEF